jgi:hypothetical protein
MAVWTTRFAWAVLLAGVLGAPGFGQPRLFTIPLGADPAAFASGTTEMEAPAGGRVCVEFRLSGEPTELFAANLLIEEPFVGPAGGLLIVEDSPRIDREHPAFIGSLYPTSPLVSQQNCCCAFACRCPPEGACDADFRAGYLIAGLAPEDFATVPETSVYLGQHCYQAGPQLGSFVVEWLEPEMSTKLVAPGETEPIPGVIYDPHVVHVVECTEQAQCVIDDPCVREACVDGVCTYRDVAYGDVDGNAVRNLFDIICIIKGMAGEFEECTFEDADIEPCGGNGELDEFDAVAAAEAIVGVDPCCQ